MEQTRFSVAGSFELKSRTTRKRVFLVEMQQVVPWNELEAIIVAPVREAVRPEGWVFTLCSIGCRSPEDRWARRSRNTDKLARDSHSKSSFHLI